MSIYQHFRPEERELIDQILGWKEQVKSYYTPKLTDFMDPREIHVVETVIGQDPEVKVFTFGGSEKVERKRVMLCPDYFTPSIQDYHISLFEVTYPNKFVTIEHRQVLGSLMSLGLKREKFGDVLIANERVQFLAAEEMETYLTANLEKIGKSSIKLKKIPITEIIELEENWEEITFTSSSMRLDAILSSVTKLSRQKAQILIEQGKVKVNWKQVDTSSFELKEGDILSVRGFGRCKIVSIDGKTKKEKWRITAGRQK